MNIAAAMAALRTDLTPTDRLALVVLACRADRYSGTVTRSVPALASDMGVHERTAQRALSALRRRGYLQVTHNRGITSTYRLVTPGMSPGVTHGGTPGVPTATGTRTHGGTPPDKRKTRERQEGARPLADTAAGASGVENPAAANGSTWKPDRPGHGAGCRCEGVGVVEVEPGRFAPCEG